MKFLSSSSKISETDKTDLLVHGVFESDSFPKKALLKDFREAVAPKDALVKSEKSFL